MTYTDRPGRAEIRASACGVHPPRHPAPTAPLCRRLSVVVHHRRHRVSSSLPTRRSLSYVRLGAAWPRPRWPATTSCTTPPPPDRHRSVAVLSGSRAATRSRPWSLGPAGRTRSRSGGGDPTASGTGPSYRKDEPRIREISYRVATGRSMATQMRSGWIRMRSGYGSPSRVGRQRLVQRIDGPRGWPPLQRKGERRTLAPPPRSGAERPSGNDHRCGSDPWGAGGEL